MLVKILDTIHLTNNQKTVLALIASNKEKPAKAATSVATGANIVAARNSLMAFGLISYTPSHATLTDKGEDFAKNINIIDDAGTLTDDGTQLISKLPGQQPQQPTNQVPTPAPDQLGLQPDVGGELGMESFSQLFMNILNEKIK
jgi:hypothetical protein